MLRSDPSGYDRELRCSVTSPSGRTRWLWSVCTRRVGKLCISSVLGDLTLPDPCYDSYPPEKLAVYRQGMKEALEAGNEVLKAGGNALDAVVVAIVTLESELSGL